MRLTVAVSRRGTAGVELAVVDATVESRTAVDSVAAGGALGAAGRAIATCESGGVATMGFAAGTDGLGGRMAT